MRCTTSIHWKIQVVIFDFFIRVNIAIRKYLLHRKAGIKQTITPTLNRSRFFKSARHAIQFLVRCVVEQSENFQFPPTA